MFGLPEIVLQEKIEKELEGGGIVLYGRYFLTAGDVVDKLPLAAKLPVGIVYLPYEKSEKYYLRLKNNEIAVDVKMKAIYMDHKNDIALFELPKDVAVSSFPYPFGNSDDLRLGNFTYVVGFPRGLIVNARGGIVSAASG